MNPSKKGKSTNLIFKITVCNKLIRYKKFRKAGVKYPLHTYEKGGSLKGWWGKILRVDLSNKEVKVEEYSEDIAKKFIGGRGLAVKTLWEEVKNVEPLSPENKLIFAAGPLNGLTTPSNGKLVVASKSPLTGGYGEGNLGSRASVHLRKAGYDALIIEGKSDEPIYLHIEDDEVNILSADGLWGLDTFETEDKLTEVHGKDTGVLNIGPGGENLVKYSVVISQKGRSGGRPGMGAVMGSKNLKAVVLKGNKDIPVANEEKLQEIATEGYKTIQSKPEYDFWIRQGTMAASQWTNDNDALPTRNFKEGTFEFSRSMDGYAMEGMKVDRKGCPNCSMQCGNVVLDHEGKEAELDYENVALLGSNLGIGQLNKISVLNRIADQMGLDTISLGNTMGFLMEANEEGLIDEGPSFGDYEGAVELAKNIAQRKGKLGDIGAEGVKKASKEFGGKEKAMHVKGLEISGYNCFIYPGMALAFGTCSIGAHHKEAWVIATEIGTAPMEEDREESKYQITYDEDIIDEVIKQQRLKGGMFESLTACRLPWIELGFDLDWYLKYLEAATGIEYTMEDMYEITDRVRSLTRSYWIREFEGAWDRELDQPPKRWFNEGLKKGEYEGMKLDEEKYEEMLSSYYEKRGWDKRGVPTKKTLEKQELEFVIPELENHTDLK